MQSFLDFFRQLFDTSDFMPRWTCGRWTNAHGWLYIISNLLIGIAYFAIPLMLVVFLRKMKKIPLKGVFFMFSLFIVFCGVTHILDAIMFWLPLYRLNAVMLSLTALVSIVTVVMLFKNLPLALSLKSPEQLQQIIDEQTAALKLSNQKLKKSEEQFRALVNNNPDIITLMGSNLQYKFVNDALASVSKKDLNSFAGKTAFDILPDHPHTPIFTTQLQHVFNTGLQTHYEVEAKTEKLGTAYFSVDMIPLRDELNVTTDVLTISRNITSTRENEKKLNETITTLDKLSKRLEYKRNTLQDFTYIVSHNLRSPTGNLISLINFYKRADNEEKKELLLSKIFAVSDQLANTVHDLTEVLNITQSADLKLELLNFGTVVDNQVKNVAAQVMETGAKIECNFSACETISYPKVYLESIILNLLTNALKYSSSERTPLIIFKSAVSEKGVISLVCKDNGQGIDLEKYGKKIFSLHKTFHNSPDARGVGLFITKNQIKAMGGNITVESEPDKGATFTILFNETELL